MDNNKKVGLSEEIKDATWKNADGAKDAFGEIKFRKSNKKSYLKSFSKVISLIMIAAISGGLSAQYVIYKDNLPKDLQENKMQGMYENPISAVAQKVLPAVVGISNKLDGTWSTLEGSASGIIFKSDGFIVTNYHVIDGAKEINVRLSNDNVLKASVVGMDSRSDLAVIKVEANNLPIITFGDSSKVKVGDIAVAIGNPLGEQFSGTVTSGIISAVDRRINIVDKKTGDQTIYKVIQTDATISQGNNGGPLCNIYGEVIGINSLKINPGVATEGLGFAINSNQAKDIIHNLMIYGKIIRPSIGIYGGTAISVGSNGVEGVYVQEVLRGSGAASAGIMPTDIIIELGGKSVKNMEELSDILEKYKVSDRVPCKVWRSGKIKDINITLSELKKTN